MCILYNVTGWNTPPVITIHPAGHRQQTKKQKKQKSIVTITGEYRNDKHKLQPISADNPEKP